MVFLTVAGGLLAFVLAFWSVLFCWEGGRIRIGSRSYEIPLVFGWILLAIYVGIGAQVMYEIRNQGEEQQLERQEQGGQTINEQVDEIFE